MGDAHGLEWSQGGTRSKYRGRDDRSAQSSYLPLDLAAWRVARLAAVGASVRNR